jgi:hypothetical protein
VLLFLVELACVELTIHSNLEPNGPKINRIRYGRLYISTLNIVNDRPRQRQVSPRLFVRPEVLPIVSPPPVAPVAAPPAVQPVVAPPAVAPVAAVPVAAA